MFVGWMWQKAFPCYRSNDSNVIWVRPHLLSQTKRQTQSPSHSPSGSRLSKRNSPCDWGHSSAGETQKTSWWSSFMTSNKLQQCTQTNNFRIVFFISRRIHYCCHTIKRNSLYCVLDICLLVLWRFSHCLVVLDFELWRFSHCIVVLVFVLWRFSHWTLAY